MRRWLVLILVLVGVSPVVAQATPWSAWLYNANGTMTRISSEGAVLQDVTLPTVEGQAYPARVAVSRTGNFVAYVTENPQLGVHRIVLYDLPLGVITGDVILTDLLAHSLSYRAAPTIFNESDTVFALGLAPQDGRWRVAAMSTANGQTLAELHPDDPAAAALGLNAGVGIVPIVLYAQGSTIVFTLQSGDTSSTFAYEWNWETGAVGPHVALSDAGWDLFAPTGELVMAVSDPALPANMAQPQTNALHVYTPTVNRFFPFYATPDRALDQPHFVQNGERVLVETWNGSAATWQVLERSGTVAGEFTMQSADIFPLADGFIYLTPTNPALLMVANTRARIDAGTAVGQAAPDASIQLAWAGDASPPPVSAYVPWLDLLDTVSVAQATQVVMLSATAPPTPTPTLPTETPTPTEPGFYVAPTPNMLPTPVSFRSQLAVGDRAVVTAAGHGAGLHTDPDDAAPAIILLYTDMVVDVLEGPEITDGYIWWRVEVETPGRQHTGWAIEGAQGAAWLVPLR